MGKMEKRPTLEEVKEYFKDADTVESISGQYKNKVYTIKIKTIEYDSETKSFYSDCEESCTDCLLWDKKGYAKILTYKNNDMKLSKKFIKDNADKTLKEVFPELFKVEFKLNTWYKRKWQNGDIDLFLISEKVNDKFISSQFFRNGKELKEGIGYKHTGLNDERYCQTEATESEIFDALKNEAVKRGYENGNYKCLALPNNTHHVSNNYHMDCNNLLHGTPGLKSNIIFSNGVWASIIPIKEMTHSEIENELGYKIKIV